MHAKKKSIAGLVVVFISIAAAGCGGSRSVTTGEQATSTTGQERRGEALLHFEGLNRLVTLYGPLVEGRIESAEEHRLRGRTDARPGGYEYDYTFVAYTLRIEKVWHAGHSGLSVQEDTVINGVEGPATIGTWYGGRAPTVAGDRLLAFLSMNDVEMENEIARRRHPDAPVVAFSDDGGVWLLEDRAGGNGSSRTYATNIFAARSGPLEEVLARIEHERSFGFVAARNGPEYNDHTPSPGYRIGGQDFHVDNEPAPPGGDGRTVATEPDI